MKDQMKTQETEEKKVKKEKSLEEKIEELKKKLSEKRKEIRQLKKEKEELNDKYLRKLAEFDNLRKRLEREKSEYYQYALSEFLKELLNVVDNFERALSNPSPENGEGFRRGVELIYKQLLDILLKAGVKPIEAKNKEFDPRYHQALDKEESDEVESPIIGEEFQKGYLLFNRLLRPALVKVIIPKKKGK
ncbi:nucleotide exchange factor GrpE [SCandidatus Aminicenantes bacterium Aminicenantia_JdfR_composite]|jgi:molecular chaperone GrpE|nr:nucleotide exchange factor GrpE [SCandidatus Aminicenantes bacterium Aminicenantia_JdfR_composite]MCP2598020.1 nucleotide exchange factor GrpE [Candidatus Aminicenantes bacterium AC-335-L06]